MSTPTKPRDPAASMSLIREITEHPLDPSYEQVAAQRRAAGLPQQTSLRSPGVIIACVLVGFAIAVAALALRIPHTQVQAEKDALIQRVDSAQSRIDKANATIQRTQLEITTLQNEALQREDQDALAARLAQAETTSGTLPVTGDGLVLEVNDAKDTAAGSGDDPRDLDDSNGRLTSTDMQILVNGLWQGGAEAIAINGQRLTSLSAIRFAGQAILVNFRPLQPPYDIVAIGPASMRSAFQKSASGAYLDNLTGSFDLRASWRTGKQSLPAAPAPVLSYATVPEEKNQ
ncbi:uncharacterized protein YlxW (UPF0749 family) [Branchiibius hedensis]|uniref:Uncharacterized conserved protein YlxW, UPF0749 family n=1 Tax=Branchiibius hedensis TaxID=672460 RepID=A0A2Y8ZNG5_9MICO|nr:DUF881 domain-containing protein [Branchiibius hedensis]PWJ25045.1 uncharacterized protein YlxW (UPF0749 family) [Branchiibius hedensis]SSA33860.1 Uncharacterized conserved protein YlxW, UPF0749 family [Branchiibius hedensis]